jgi:hypothetical protein
MSTRYSLNIGSDYDTPDSIKEATGKIFSDLEEALVWISSKISIDTLRPLQIGFIDTNFIVFEIHVYEPIEGDLIWIATLVREVT